MSFAEDYVDVAERLRLFREKYPEGSMQPADLAVPYRIETIGTQTFVVYVAAAYRTADDLRPGVGVAWEEVPGKTNFTRGSELMNAETSAWGRAIVAVLAADTKRVASVNEIQNRSPEPEVYTPGQASLDKAQARCKALAAAGIDILAARTEAKLPPLARITDETQWLAWGILLDDLGVIADETAAMSGRIAGAV